MDRKTLQQLESKAGKLVKFITDKKLTWCGNCGNFGIQNALQRALVLDGFERNDFLLCFDIGCSGNGSDKFNATTLHGLHGRVLPIAAGAALANPKMKVIAEAGDGATFSEGVNHLVHAVQNNYPVTFLLHNNESYSLTTGQASSLTRCGAKMNGVPDGVEVAPINSLQFVLSLNPSYVARTYSGNVDHMTETIRHALKHKGFAYVEIIQACPTYNRAAPEAWYAPRIKDIRELKDYDNHDIWQARRIVDDVDKEIYVGLLYENPEKKEFISLLKSQSGKKTTLIEEVKHYDIKRSLARL